MASNYDSQEFIESDGFFYIQKEGDEKYLYCRLANNGCPGLANKIREDFIVITNDHNHLEDSDFYFGIRFKKFLITAAHEYFVPPCDIYNYLAETFREGAAMLPFHDVKNLIENEQDKIILQQPESFQQFCDILSHDQHGFLNAYYLQRNECHFIHQINFDNDALLFYPKRTILSIKVENIYISSTNAVLPNIGNVKLLTFVLAEYANHIFPVALILWNKRSEEVARDVICCIQEAILNKVTNIITDFDLKSVIQSAWPEGTITSTFDSFYRILYHQAHSRQLNISNSDHRDFLRKCTTIILLPYEMANAAFQILIDNLSKQLRMELNKFIIYFHQIWVECGNNDGNDYLFNNFLGLNIVSRNFSIKLTSIFGSNPTTTTFLRKLVGLFHDAEIDMEKLKSNQSITMTEFPQRTNFITEREIIENIWAKISNKEISGNSVVEELSMIIDKYYRYHNNNLEILSEMQLIRVNDKKSQEIHDNLMKIESKEMVRNNKKGNSGNVCRICDLNKIDIMCIPCGHVQMCKECSDRIEITNITNDLKCPFCNTPAYYQKAFLS